MRVSAFYICVAVFGSIILTQEITAIRDVTHEDIRDAILSLVHMFRDNTDKLERHEYRERQLGEQLKKAFVSVEKKQKTEESSMNSIIESLTNIDKRLQAIETNSQQASVTSQADPQPVDLEPIITKLNALEESIKQNALVNDLKTDMNGKIIVITNNIENMQTLLKQLIERPMPTQNPDALSGNIVSVIEAKLSEIKPLLKEWQNSYEATNSQNESAELFKKASENILQTMQSLPKREDLLEMLNNTVENIQELKYDILLNSEKSVSRIQEKIDKTRETLSEEQGNTLKAVSDGIVTAEGLHNDVKNSYEQLAREIKGLLKVEQVLIQTADNVLDNKRRIEYGTHQILLEVGDLVKQQAKDMNATINGRFDDISATILDNQNGALTNLSSKIETEISQVWRQIGIMYQTLTASKVALDRLQQQTEIYVNGSLSTMDNMEGKVGQITGRMSEVDDNLNYLLGRLSLVTQEFNQIKLGLGEALDNIRSSFHTVQEKVKDVGPGPNPIEESRENGAELSKTQYETTN